MNLQIINPITYPEWDKLLLSNPGYSFFHSSSWARVLTESYHYKPLYFILIRDNKLLVTLPIMEIENFITGKKGVSLPFTDSADPIFVSENHNSDTFGTLVEYGNQEGWKSIEIRGGARPVQESTPSSLYYGHVLDLSPGEEQIYSSFRDNTKRNIKKAIREGINVKICNSLSSLNEFYRLNCLTRKMHGLPPQPSFFLRICMNMLFQKILVLLCWLHIRKELLLELSIFTLGKRLSSNMVRQT